MEKYIKIVKVILVIAAVIYGINPADPVIPDIIPILGYVDDIAVALIALGGFFGLGQLEKKPKVEMH